MAMIVKNLMCSRCGSPLKSKETDLVLFCTHCGATMEFVDNDAEPVGLHILASSAVEREVVYIPFWRVDADISVDRVESTGGFPGFGMKPMRGPQRFYVCAAGEVHVKDLGGTQALRACTRLKDGWNVEFTRVPPAGEEIPDFGRSSRLEAVKTSRAAEKDAEFLFLKQEVAAVGTLQEIEYTFQVKGHEVVYVPFVRSGSGYTPALSF